MADRADIDRVREATDIVELISEVTKVKRSGRSFMAVCPFHQEKTPSMSVDRARGLYHCFGCGKSGDIFTFVEETQGGDFRDALEFLARKAGIAMTVDPEAAKTRGRQGEAVEALRRGVDVYAKRLKKSPQAGPARAYLRGRGYDLDLIDEWKLGFAGVDWDTLTKELRAGGIGDRALVDSGLSRKGRHGLYDVFRGRLMFPILDVRGEPVGFGARKVEGVPRDSTNNPDAKYVNSAESIVYHKARLLYALDRARKAISDSEPAVVVEGYTDVIAMHQAGIKTAVATCGTALGDDHFDLLRRFGDRVVLAFDSDEAGSKAALRGDELESPFRLDLDLRVAALPAGLDPADLVQQGRQAELATAVRTARPLLERRIEYEVSRHDLTGPEGRARALHAAATQVRRVNDQITRREYERFVARLVGAELSDVEAAVSGSRRRASEGQQERQVPLDRLESELMRVILSGAPGLESVKESDFSDPRLRRGFQAIQGQVESAGPINISSIEDETAKSLLTGLALDEKPLAGGQEVLARVRTRQIESQIAVIETELSHLEPGSEAHSDMLRRLIALQKERRSTAEA